MSIVDSNFQANAAGSPHLGAPAISRVLADGCRLHPPR
jgi:hypothetical protein